MRPLPLVAEQGHAGRGRVGRVQVGDDLLDRVAVFQAVFGQQPQPLPEIILATVILLAAFAVQDAIAVAFKIC